MSSTEDAASDSSDNSRPVKNDHETTLSEESKQILEGDNDQKDDVCFIHTALFDGELGEKPTRNDDGTQNLPYAEARKIYSEAIGGSTLKTLKITEDNIPNAAEKIVQRYKKTIRTRDLDREVEDGFYDRLFEFQKERMGKRLNNDQNTAYDLPLR